MDAWKRKRTSWANSAPVFVTTFTPIEREVLGDLVANVTEALINRARAVPRDELAELTGMPSGHSDAPTDPGMARLLPDFFKEGEEEFEGDNGMMRSIHESDITKEKVTRLFVMSEDLGPTSSLSVELDEDQAQAWLVGLNDVRLYYASAELQQHPEAERERQQLIEWLAYCQDSLLHAMFDEYDEIGHVQE